MNIIDWHIHLEGQEHLMWNSHSHTLMRIRSLKLTPHILRPDRIFTACKMNLLYFLCTSIHRSFRSIASHQQVLVLPSMDKSPVSSMGMRLISPKSSLERTNIFLEWSVKLERSWTYKIGVKLESYPSGTHQFWALSEAALGNLASFCFRRYLLRYLEDHRLINHPQYGFRHSRLTGDLTYPTAGLRLL